ncbi:hypothetical protein [uncultured Kordia sp.]|uniref:hypothetical protein n=1 Tax=uncultured Kordia sp. TaxID=507699 RepID=UPI002626113F|nr:hypothetical protein [uncultured Kordia sp.]
MKNKRSIQKLKVNKKTISMLNAIIAGDAGVTRTSMGGKPYTKHSDCTSNKTAHFSCSDTWECCYE